MEFWFLQSLGEESINAIKQHHLEDIKVGNISLAFRKWKKPSVLKRSLLKTAIGQVEICNIKKIDISAISGSEARKAGFNSLDELLHQLKKVKEGKIYKIEVAYHSPDPRIKLRS
ncbi:MAG: hypothetical protein AAF363_11635 [Bacteroidota bacterium]